MFGFCSEKKYLQLKQDYESKMKEVSKLTADIVKRIHELEAHNSDIADSVQDLHSKVTAIYSYLDENGKKKTVDGIQVSDFALFVNDQGKVNTPAETKSKNTAKTTRTRKAKSTKTKTTRTDEKKAE